VFYQQKLKQNSQIAALKLILITSNKKFRKIKT
jgi:hypothetical protein